MLGIEQGEQYSRHGGGCISIKREFGLFASILISYDRMRVGCIIKVCIYPIPEARLCFRGPFDWRC